jgi:hypothetical protein
MRITRHPATRWPKPPRRQAKFAGSIPDGGAASISKRRGVVWDDGGEGAIHEPHRSLPFRRRVSCPCRRRRRERAAALIEFSTANIRNRNTRRAYAQAVSEFLAWCEDRRVPVDHGRAACTSPAISSTASQKTSGH